MNRGELFSQLKQLSEVDVIVIGGGATGLGVALESVTRGYSTLLLEKYDFGKGTSSKATKLLHGGVRYLQKGDVSLVIEALAEREFVLNQAPHLSNIQEFVIPHYSYWRGWYYMMGLLIYDILSGKKSLGKTRKLNKKETLDYLPNLKKDGLKGGILYTDGQFDDTRLCIDLVHTIIKKGGLAINYCKVTDLIVENGTIKGVSYKDEESGDHGSINAKVVVNATGVFAEETMNMEGEASANIKIVPARGSHIVLDQSFLDSKQAIMIPKTSDGRVLFLVPWHNVVIVGTTDHVSKTLSLEPYATEKEIDFILQNAANYLDKKPTKEDILSTFAGLRPLAAPKKEGKKSKEISRSHKIVKSKAGLYSVLGGKWTTFRKMGEDTINKIVKHKVLSPSTTTSSNVSISNGMVSPNEKRIHEKLHYSWNQIEHIIKTEFAEKVEDVLCRRTRCLLLNKQATLEILDDTLQLMASIKGYDDQWIAKEQTDFLALAEKY